MLNWQQKLQALNVLTPHVLCMRKPGDWFVNSNLTIREGCVNIGTYGNGESPQEAVNDHWEIYTNLEKDEQCISVCDGTHVVWDTFMWKQVKPK
jgi:hypothetical protein